MYYRITISLLSLGLAFLMPMLIPQSSEAAETELIANGGFEAIDNTAGFRFPSWSTTDGSICANINSGLAAEGGNFIVLCFHELWQDVSTIPGHPYRLSFAMNGWIGQEDGLVNVVRVFWGEQEICLATNYAPFGITPWIWTNLTVHAEGSFTRLRFQRAGGFPSVDAVSLVSLEESAGFTAPIVSQSAFTGSQIQMVSKPAGSPPLALQWYKEGAVLAGKTDAILLLENVTTADAGDYTCSVSNQFGLKVSNAATLLVRPIPAGPVILAQPKSQNVVAGYGVTLTVAAGGEGALFYQWQHEGTNVPAGTNTSLTLATVSSVDAGVYRVAISNANGAALSLPANLTVVAGTAGGGYVEFSNRFPTNRVNGQVFDLAGNPLVGETWAAQLYAGVTAGQLHAIGGSAYFLTASLAGYFNANGQNPLTVPDVPAGEPVFLQLRVWETAFGSTFEESRVRGGKYGRSATILVRPAEFAFDPAPLLGLNSFAVRTGDSLFASAKFSAGNTLPDGRVEWNITGELGAIYNIEGKDNPGQWTPLALVTNITGTVQFIDPHPPTSGARLYRAQILD